VQIDCQQKGVAGGLAEGEEILPKSRGRSGIPTYSPHIFWDFKSIDHTVHCNTSHLYKISSSREEERIN
jgi:hypothetical protein